MLRPIFSHYAFKVAEEADTDVREDVLEVLPVVSVLLSSHVSRAAQPWLLAVPDELDVAIAQRGFMDAVELIAKTQHALEGGACIVCITVLCYLWSLSFPKLICILIFVCFDLFFQYLQCTLLLLTWCRQQLARLHRGPLSRARAGREARGGAELRTWTRVADEERDPQQRADDAEDRKGGPCTTTVVCHFLFFCCLMLWMF